MSTDARPPSSGPLAGLKVIEICSTVAGPACARLMGDFGAEVIKIEPPDGDNVRQIGRHVGDISLYAASILRNKKSVALNLKSDDGRRIALELARRADILVENNRPGVMERLGLGYEQLSEINPGIVMVRISGFGQDGPYAARPGYGAICEAVGGVRHMTGDPDRPPARVALATTDYLSAVYAAFGAMVAIHNRGRSGKGQVVDVALYEAAYTQMESYVPAFEKLGFIPTRVGSNLPTMAPNSLYATRDGSWILIAANSNAIFERLLRLMRRSDLLEDPRFSTIRARGERPNMVALDGIIGEWTRTLDARELEELLRGADVPTSRVYTIADIYGDAHYRSRHMLVEVPHPVLGHTTQIGVVPRLSDTPGSIRRTGPEVGADSDEVLASLGYDAEQIASLRRMAVVGAS